MASAAHTLAPPRPPRVSGGLSAALLGVLIGSALQLQQPALFPAPVYIGLVLVSPALWALASWVPWPRWPGRAWWGGLAVAVAAFGLCGWRATTFAAGALSPALEGRDVLVTGVVSAMPQRQASGLRLRLAVEAAQLEGGAVYLPPVLDLGWYGDTLEDAQEGGAPAATGFVPPPGTLRAGERWRMVVRLKAPHGLRNPHGFDYELWMWGQGVQATGYVRSGPRDPVPQRLAVTWRYPLEQMRQKVRDAIFRRLGAEPATPDTAAQVRAAGLVAALVVGDQRAIERSDWDIFRATGVAHLMSISGLHITMFAWLAAVLLGWAWRRSAWLCLRVAAPHAALVGGLVLAAVYAAFSGWGVPSQRTVWMLAMVVLLRLSGRRWPWPQVWLLACAVVVAVDPWALLQAGFWLSFVAVGVLFATDAGGAFPAGAARPVWDRLRAMVREQWVVTVALAPLTLLLFGQVSVVGLVANMLAIPWVTLVVTPLAMLGILLPPLWDAAAWALRGGMVVLQWLAEWPFATVSLATPAIWAGAASLLGGVLLVARLPWVARLLGVPLVLPVLLWQAPRPPAGAFELLAADVGQGSAVLVRTAAHTLVYDTGPQYSLESDAGSRVLVPLLRALGERVDTLVLSHQDLDHTGGAAAVLAMQPQAALRSSLGTDHALLRLRPSTRCVAGQQWRWDGVLFEVLHPLAEDYAEPRKPNALSCVLRISNPDHSVLLAGDIEAAQEARLAATGSAVRADVLLVPHHGSKTSSSAAFLDAVQPRIALVQAGYRNHFGHPAATVMARYGARGVAVYSSVSCGAATWSSGQPDSVQCTRQQAPRYWQHGAP